MFTADSYSVGEQPGAVSGSISGIADTGTSLLLLDDGIVQDYWGHVKGSQNDSSQGGYTFPCSANLPDFSISVGGETRTGRSNPCQH
jgi:aspergillopepsin I